MGKSEELKETQKAELREKILNTSIDLFRSTGLKGVNTELIAGECGISKKTLYEVFESKEELISYVITTSLGKLESDLKELAANIESREMTDFGEVFHHLMQGVNKIIIVFSKQFLADLKKYYPNLWIDIREYKKERIKNYFGLIFQIGQKNGYIRADINPELAYYIHHYILDNIVSPEVLAELPLSSRDVMQGIYNILLFGLLTPKGIEQSEFITKLNKMSEHGLNRNAHS
jgi:AcrR family transcriptional regulator